MTLVFPVFLILLFTAMPAAFAIGIASLLYYLVDSPIPVSIAVQKLATATQSFPLLAIPLFILAGNLMNRTGITHRLLDFSKMLTGWMVGGMAQVSIVLSTLMGGVSGSAVADASMQSRILGGHMIESGYSKGFTAAVIAYSAVITATIPPSIGLIVFGFVGNVSIGKLLLAGIVPGLLLMVIYMFVTWGISKRNNYQPELESLPTLKELGNSFVRSIWALMFPVLLLVGIRFGVFTPTEAGAFVVLYSLIVGIFIHKELNWKAAMEALQDSVTDVGVVTLIVMTSAMLGHVFVLDQVPQTISQLILGLSDNTLIVFLLMMLFMIVVGMLMEATVNVLLLTPILLPLATGIGLDPVHFGVIFVTMVSLGGNTPPVGVCMYTVCGLLKVSTWDYFVASIPFILSFLALMVVLLLVPDLVMYLPNQFSGF
ncbi:TRAP transporter large permease [Halomonas sp. HAL1]|uniref:TRAP transporter large permease n=1 Tax=Halomonas sp. HAL1 TaxID=550984 RepID=UPI00022D27F4|nr:TRAP transporter large permease [Halomonas sp. HAL1]EHA14700.1 TRAP dicarboxylate transporter subunit DctM [Halomonas sp. HAL1]WKV93407.1 TRAP transporter large permease [Halomonas sp. HAL1]